MTKSRIAELREGCGRFKFIGRYENWWHFGWCKITQELFTRRTNLCKDCERKLVLADELEFLRTTFIKDKKWNEPNMDWFYRESILERIAYLESQLK